MQIQKNKHKMNSIALTLILTMTIAIGLVALPAANAHSPKWDITTYAFITMSPNPVGVGQNVGIVMWLDKLFDPAISIENNWRFHNYNLTIVDSGGAKVHEKIFETVIDTTSSQFYSWTPSAAGTYTVIFTFPGQDYNTYSHNPASALVNDTYLASSASTTLTVQTEPLPDPINSYPLPQEYWTRPIWGENTDWWSISSNWLGTGSPGYSQWATFGSSQRPYPGDAIGPETPHVMWTMPLQFGGVVGGNNFPIQGNTWFEGSAYNQRFTNPIIVSGRLYYTEPNSFYSEGSFFFGPAPQTFGPTTSVDLRTGKVIWSRNDVPPLSFAYIYDVEDPQQHGVYPAILIAATGGGFFGGAIDWRAFDAYTGTPLFNVTNVPTGTTVLGPQGEHLKYVFANVGTPFSPNWTLGQWNSSKLWSGAGFTKGDPGLSPAIGNLGTVPGNNANASDPSYDYDWNVPASYVNTMLAPFPGANPVSVIAAFYNDVIIAQNGTLPGLATGGFGTTSSAPYTYFAINLNASRAPIGSVLWWNTLPAPPGNVSVLAGDADPVSRIFYEAYKETRQFVGYSMDTGQKVWGPTDSQPDLDYYGNPATPNVPGAIAYGKLYSAAYGGVVHAYDMATGNLLWTYGNGGPGNSTNAGFYGGFANYPTFINAIGNGIIYLVTSEHTVQTPIYKGALARAINATDGTELWTLSDYTGEFFTTSFAMADGFATFFNGYSNQIYSVGRGPSAITADAPRASIVEGSSVVITGMVTDISAGTKQDEQAARFANGVPAMSDASMDDWMGYVYQQKPKPTDAIGVEVIISVTDSNNNTRDIGRTTTDSNGFYSFQYTPEIPGKFIVYARFAGSKAYWPSIAEAAFAVDPAPQVTPPPEDEPSMTDTYVMYAAIAIIITIVIVGALIILMQRRH